MSIGVPKSRSVQIGENVYKVVGLGGGFALLSILIVRSRVLQDFSLVAVLILGCSLALFFHYRLLLAIFIFGLGLRAREFAYLSISAGPMPVYISEGVLITLFFIGLLRSFLQGKIVLRKTPLDLLLVSYISLGLLYFIIGLPEYGIWAARDAVITYYGIFYFIFYYATENVKHIGLWVFSAAFTVVLPALFTVIAMLFPGIPVYVSGGNEALSGVLFCSLIGAWSYLRGKWIYLISICFPLLTNLMGYFRRSLFLGIGLSICLMAIIGKPLKYFYVVRRICMGLVLFSMVTVLYMASLPDEPWSRGLVGRLNRGYGLWETERGDTVQGIWRTIIWKRYLMLSLQKPFLGWGFGYQVESRLVNPNPEQADEPITHAHNGFITVFFRMGLLGLALMGAILFVFYRNAIRFIKNTQDERLRNYMLGLIGAHAFMMVYASFNVVLENPYYGLWFWMPMGLAEAVRKIGRETEV